MGPALIVVVLVLVLPPAFLITSGIATAILGWVATKDAEDRHEGSELVELNY